MEKPRMKKLFGPVNPMSEPTLKKPKKPKKEPSMLEYHKKRTKKMGMM